MTLAETLSSLLPPDAELRFGELYLTRDEGGIFAARHRDDRNSEDGLELVDSCHELRELAKFDADGEYRPLKTAPVPSEWLDHKERGSNKLPR